VGCDQSETRPERSMPRTPGRRPRTLAALAVATAVALLSACSGGGTDARPAAKSGGAAAASRGLDRVVLDRIAAEAKRGKSNCLLVERDGKIAGEWYFDGTGPGTPQDVYSVTKSVTSVLVGIAQDDGDLSITDSASTWIPEWRGTPAEAVTVRDLLSNDSGRQWSPTTDYLQLLAAPDRTAFAIGLQQTSAPGTVWAYNNSAIQTLQRVLRGATGENVVDFAQQRLFGPLGMTNTEMTTDRAGNAQMFEGVRSTCRDLARFGRLVLDGGTWHGRRIVSAAWVAESTGKSSTTLNAGYGYLWWLNHEGAVTDPLVATDLQAASNPKTEHRRIVPGAPDDMFWALGLGNQLVQVDPGSRTVVVRLGTAEARPRPPTFGPAQASQVVTQALH
jgi:CubicO group peptidase (beta-lactamase class C family)